MKIRFLAASIVLMSVAGCRCKSGGTGDNLPDYAAKPVAINFEACPTKDEAGKAVSDVFPDEKKVTITNRSKGGGGLSLSFTGDGKDSFTQDPKKADPANPTSIAALSDQVLTLSFSPTKKGVVRAQLVINDETAETADVKVDLVGTGSDLAAQPTIKVSTINSAGKATECQEGLVCEQNFVDTLFAESATVDLKITNAGCPALKITGLEIVSVAGQSNAYFIDSPSILPTTATPIILTQAGGLQTTTVKIRFAPGDDGSGNLVRFATLRVKTNDPNAKDGDNNKGGFDVLLSGSALKPAIYTTPTRCDFTDMTDTCGNAAKIAGKANFLVKNEGNVAVKIDSTTFKSNNSETAGQDNRLTITGAALKGVTIQPGMSAPLEVTHTEMPLYIQDLLTISASVVPNGMPGSAGRAVISLSGGKKPCLSTEPGIDITGQAKLDFGAPSTELSAKELTIKNGPAAMCGDLIISSISIVDAPSPFFSIIDPPIAPGTKIPPGTELKTTIQYKKPVSGGTQVGSLRISSNDGAFATPPGYIVQLYSQSPLDQLPVAVLKACVPSDTACTMPKTTVSLASLPAGPGGTKLLTISGKESYDPQPDGGQQRPLAGYQFGKVPGPLANTATLSDEARDAGQSVTLSLDGVTQGNMRLLLDVWDSANQKSGVQGSLQIQVGP